MKFGLEICARVTIVRGKLRRKGKVDELKFSFQLNLKFLCGEQQNKGKILLKIEAYITVITVLQYS